jgi:DNA ligase-associated metallophosphoesterase
MPIGVGAERRALMKGDLTVELAGERVMLLPERALFWPRTHTLFVADVHWGKAAAFRAASIALPGGSTSDDLARLGAALARAAARRLVILGDLLHARAGRAPRTLAAVSEWRARNAELEVVLVRGNHDRGAGDPPPEWGFACLDAPALDPPFVLSHHPGDSAEGYLLAGHIHPTVQLVGAARQRVKLPCFLFGPRAGILPAFGGFTGTALVAPQPGDRVYVVVEDEVIQIGLC